MYPKVLTPFPYFGGKAHMMPWLLRHLPPSRVFVDVFGGSGAVLLSKPKSEVEFYNDLNHAVVNMFRIMREHPYWLLGALQLTPYAREERRRCMTLSGASREDARRTYFVNVSSFGGGGGNLRGMRFNRERSEAKDYRTRIDRIPLIADRLKDVQIENCDALSLITRVDAPDTLLYLDPPYVFSTRSGGLSGAKGNDYAHELDDEGHRRLAEVTHNCASMVAISGYPSELYDELYADWYRYENDVACHIAGKKGKKTVRRKEVLWTNYKFDKELDLFYTSGVN